MNILFLTLYNLVSLEHSGIYEDLLREFVRQGHQVSVASPAEGSDGARTRVVSDGGARILKIKTGSVQKTNPIRKGIATLLIESQFTDAIKNHFGQTKFDLVLYSTPPITFLKAVSFVKRRDRAVTYLLLKDIFPQNAVDIGLFPKTGLRGLIYRFFRAKEKKLYAVSDHIGCMSQANVQYILRHNPELPPDKLSVSPNCIEVSDLSVSAAERATLRAAYDLPTDRFIFVYGGNLGKPQDVPFIVECLRTQADNPDAFFLIVGAGTERGVLEEYIQTEKPRHVRLLSSLPKDEYDRMVSCCDAGLIFLDHRFTIPNFPSRLLSYMQAGLPVLACTDSNTDLGQVVTGGGFGWWCESSDAQNFKGAVGRCLADMRAGTVTGAAALSYLKEHYRAQKAASDIMETVRRLGEKG